MKSKTLVLLFLYLSSFSFAQSIRLDQLDLSNATTGWGTIQKNLSVASNPLKINGIIYDNGLGVHAPSEISINLFSAATRFQAVVGVDDETSNKPTEAGLEFKVIGDSKVLFSSGIMKYNSAAQTIDIDITGIEFLQLIVTIGNDGVNWSDHADWCSASIDYGGNIPVCVKASEVPQQIELNELNLTNAINDNGTIKKNLSTGSNPLTINGTTYEKGIGVHAPSEINIDLKGTAKRFVATVGIDDEVLSSPFEAELEFEVLTDNNVVWSSAIMKKTDDVRTKNIDIDLTGKTYLTLKTKSFDPDNNYSNHADWTNTMISYFGTAPTCILKSSVDLKPYFANATNFFAETGNPIMTRFNVKSINPATVSVDGLPSGLSFNETRNLVSGSISAPGEYSYTVTASNEDGSVENTITLTVKDELEAPTPPMGWNTWNALGGNINETKLKEIADAIVSSGMKDAGYQYLIIDDLWAASSRDANGLLQPDPTKFPNGMKALADYMHSIGLKLGIYSDAATTTCGGSIGSYGYEVKDANQFAAWGIDMVKYDYCNAPADATTAANRYKTMSDAMKNSGRNMLFNICEWGQRNPEKWASASGGHTWRNTWDSRDIWDHGIYDGGHCGVIQGLDIQNGLEFYAGPNMWNDPDMVMAGLYGQGISSSNAGANGMSDLEYQSQFSLWCLLAAPIQTSFDVTKINAATKAILTNAEAIAIDQDILGQQASKIIKSSDTEIYVKDLADGSVAVGLLNRNNTTAQNITVNWSEIYLTGDCTVRDLWSHTDVATSSDSYTAMVAPHETVLLKITPSTTDIKHNEYESPKFEVYSANNKLNIKYEVLSQSENVDIELINLTGSVFSILKKENKTKGEYELQFNSSGLNKGIYILRYNCNSQMMTRKVEIL